MLHYNTSPFKSKLLLFDVHYAAEPLYQGIGSDFQLEMQFQHCDILHVKL